VLTRQKLGHITPVVAEAKMFSPVFPTPVTDTAVSSSEEKRDATSACQPANQIERGEKKAGQERTSSLTELRKTVANPFRIRNWNCRGLRKRESKMSLKRDQPHASLFVVCI